MQMGFYLLLYTITFQTLHNYPLICFPCDVLFCVLFRPLANVYMST